MNVNNHSYLNIVKQWPNFMGLGQNSTITIFFLPGSLSLDYFPDNHYKVWFTISNKANARYLWHFNGLDKQPA